MAGIGAIQRLIHGDRITPVLVLPTLDAGLFGRRHHADARALRFQQVLGLDQFRLLETMRGENGDLLAAKTLCHVVLQIGGSGQGGRKRIERR
ncbi:hypothetical protein D3C73_1529220 [compost metagenome]